ncbi:MAG: PaaI family thioesterase [Methylococcaceae bacterium]|nr:PaaI family thioesterase [Methylococcaceae bacterium]
MNAVEPIQTYMPGAECFGCGGNNAYGLQIKSYCRGDQILCEWTPEQKHQGWQGNTCGGILATLVDCHCMASAMAFSARIEGLSLDQHSKVRFITGSLEIRYLRPTPVGVPVLLVARLANIRKERIYTLRCDLYSGPEKTVEAEVVAFRTETV